MDQKSLGQIQQIVNVAAETLRIEIVDAKRHTSVLTERLWPDLQLVAERFQMHLDLRHADDRAYLDEVVLRVKSCNHISLLPIERFIVERRLLPFQQGDQIALH